MGGDVVACQWALGEKEHRQHLMRPWSQGYWQTFWAEQSVLVQMAPAQHWVPVVPQRAHRLVDESQTNGSPQ